MNKIEKMKLYRGRVICNNICKKCPIVSHILKKTKKSKFRSSDINRFISKNKIVHNFDHSSCGDILVHIKNN